MGFQKSGDFAFADPPQNATVTNELPLFAAWIIVPYALKYIRFVEGVERCPSCIDVFHSGFLFETLISWISKLCQITTVLLTPALQGLFFTAESILSLSTQQQLWNSPYKLKNCSSIARWALTIEDQTARTSCCPFLPFSSFTALGICSMLLWSRCGYLKPVSAVVSLGH